MWKDYYASNIRGLLFLEQRTAIMNDADKPIFHCIRGIILPVMAQNEMKTGIIEL
jgi:hypothetical protein